jgi:hypothetical protein
MYLLYLLNPRVFVLVLIAIMSFIAIITWLLLPTMPSERDGRAAVQLILMQSIPGDVLIYGINPYTIYVMQYAPGYMRTILCADTNHSLLKQVSQLISSPNVQFTNIHNVRYHNAIIRNLLYRLHPKKYDAFFDKLHRVKSNFYGITVLQHGINNRLHKDLRILKARSYVIHIPYAHLNRSLRNRLKYGRTFMPLVHSFKYLFYHPHTGIIISDFMDVAAMLSPYFW